MAVQSWDATYTPLIQSPSTTAEVGSLMGSQPFHRLQPRSGVAARHLCACNCNITQYTEMVESNGVYIRAYIALATSEALTI